MHIKYIQSSAERVGEDTTTKCIHQSILVCSVYFFWVYEYRKREIILILILQIQTANKKIMVKNSHGRKLGSLEGVRLLLPSIFSSSVNGMSRV